MGNMRIVSMLIAALAMGLASGAGHAATVSVEVRGADGKPLSGRGRDRRNAAQAGRPIRFPWPYVMAQERISFQPPCADRAGRRLGQLSPIMIRCATTSIPFRRPRSSS